MVILSQITVQYKYKIKIYKDFEKNLPNASNYVILIK